MHNVIPYANKLVFFSKNVLRIKPIFSLQELALKFVFVAVVCCVCLFPLLSHDSNYIRNELFHSLRVGVYMKHFLADSDFAANNIAQLDFVHT